MPQELDVSSILGSGTTGDVKVESTQAKPESVQLAEQELEAQKHKDYQRNLRAIAIAYVAIILVCIVFLGCYTEGSSINQAFWEKVLMSTLTAGLGGVAGKGLAKTS
jgi:hypothetical protein